MNTRSIIEKRIWVLKLTTKFCIKDPSSIKYFILYYNSLIIKDYLLKKRLPWIVFKMTDYIKKVINKKMSVFEYGMGGSTLFFSDRVAKIISIEHNPSWYYKMRKILKKNRFHNYECFLVKPTIISSASKSTNKYCSSSLEYRNKSFERYVKTIDKYDDASFDIVLIDGRSRSACITHAVKKIKEGGFLILDDSNIKSHTKTLKILSGWKRKSFFGLTPGITSFSAFGETTIYKKPLKNERNKILGGFRIC